MFFPTPLPEVIFRGPCADLGPKVRFFTDCGSQLGSKVAPWSTIFDQKVFFLADPFPGEASLEPTRARFGDENATRTHFHRFGQFFVGFGRILDQFGMIFQ